MRERESQTRLQTNANLEEDFFSFSFTLRRLQLGIYRICDSRHGFDETDQTDKKIKA